MRFPHPAMLRVAARLPALFIPLAVAAGMALTPTSSSVVGLDTAHAAFAQQGRATWYGAEFAGRTTACGYVYSPYQLTAASNTLPCHTRATVTNLATGESVNVIVTDRGGFRYPNIMDLSWAAFSQIAHPDTGVISVAVTAAEE